MTFTYGLWSELYLKNKSRYITLPSKYKYIKDNVLKHREICKTVIVDEVLRILWLGSLGYYDTVYTAFQNIGDDPATVKAHMDLRNLYLENFNQYKNLMVQENAKEDKDKSTY